jgi:hypothetical protein
LIRSQATEFRCERGRQPLPRIELWRDQLDSKNYLEYSIYPAALDSEYGWEKLFRERMYLA